MRIKEAWLAHYRRALLNQTGMPDDTPTRASAEHDAPNLSLRGRAIPLSGALMPTPVGGIGDERAYDNDGAANPSTVEPSKSDYIEFV
ncbi:hypothetical protein SAMN07250955_107140 [Arboricoccus pini]|uniref:Uncharacterized protein n=1 Tax=Arboricoccus pini TaxID=1963835 RepID=A0A212RDI1_9PROT|nr:hypothetical protein [Arboricoccus pini]SNB70203.1 hypothetical protein SAMN07250955_107140 [Arboricoccus pini]